MRGKQNKKKQQILQEEKPGLIPKSFTFGMSIGTYTALFLGIGYGYSAVLQKLAVVGLILVGVTSLRFLIIGAISVRQYGFVNIRASSMQWCGDILYSFFHALCVHTLAYAWGVIYFAYFCFWIFFEYIISCILLSVILFVSALICLSLPVCWGLKKQTPNWYRRFWNQLAICMQGFYLAYFHMAGLNIHEGFSVMYMIKMVYSFVLMILATYAIVLIVPGCAFLTLMEDITEPEQLENWYIELRERKFRRVLFFKPSFKNGEQQNQCPAFLCEQQLKLTKENLKKLLNCGLRFVLVANKPFKSEDFAWADFFFPLTKSLSVSGLELYMYHRSAFISHRWGADGTWYGADGFQFQEILKFLAKHRIVKYVWVDGLCAPQDDQVITMVVIDNLLTIIDKCHFFGCIDGSGVENEYISRVWCLYELFLGTSNQTIKDKTLAKTIAALHPDTMDLSKFQSKPLLDEFVEMLFAGCVFKASDKNRIILNALLVPTMYEDMGECSTSNWRSFFKIMAVSLRKVRATINWVSSASALTYRRFPFQLLLALHIIFLKLRTLASAEDLSTKAQKVFAESVHDSQREGSCGILLPEIIHYARVHWYHNVLGFRKYCVYEMLEIPFVEKIQLFDEADKDSEGHVSGIVCGKLALQVFGICAMVLLHCFPERKACALTFSLHDEKLELSSSLWIDWDEHSKKMMDKKEWSSYIII